MKSVLRIITRESPLAMWQAGHVRDNLKRVHPGINIEVLGIKTEADKFFDSSLASLGGKGAFVKELEQALIENRADLAVHSMKDVTALLPDGLCIGAILTRENPGDAFVSNKYEKLNDLPYASTVGTASLRRQCQIKAYRPDLKMIEMRGNVGTRLQKLDKGGYDALVLASSGLIRLGLGNRIKQEIDKEIMLPAIGQGALGIEVRSDDKETQRLVAALNHEDTSLCVAAERMVNKRLDGGCHSPIAAYAIKNNLTISISALAGRPDGTEIIKADIEGPCEEAEDLGDRLGRILLDRGAGRILEQLRLEGNL